MATNNDFFLLSAACLYFKKELYELNYWIYKPFEETTLKKKIDRRSMD